MRRFCSPSILFLLICGASLLSAKSSSLSLVLPFSFFFFCFSDLRRHCIVSTIVALVVLFVLDVSVMNKLSLSSPRRQYSPGVNIRLPFFFFFCLQPGQVFLFVWGIYICMYIFALFSALCCVSVTLANTRTRTHYECMHIMNACIAHIMNACIYTYVQCVPNVFIMCS